MAELTQKEKAQRELARREIARREGGNSQPVRLPQTASAEMRTANPINQSMEAGLISIGREMKRLGQGAQRNFGDAETVRRVEADVRRENELFKPLQDKHPIATRVAPAIASMIAPGAATVKGAAAMGAAFGLFQPEGNPIQNAAVGATVGAATKFAGDEITSLAGGRLPKDKLSRRATKVNAGKTLEQRSKELGVELTPAAAGGSFGGQIAEDAGRTNAFTAGFFQEGAESNLDNLNNAILGRFGRKGKVISGGALKEIREEIGQRFDDVVSDLSNFKPTIRSSEALEAARKRLNDVDQARTRALFSEVEEVISRPEGIQPDKISTLLNSINERLGQAGRQGDVIDAKVLEDLSETILNGVEDSMTQVSRRHLRSARRDWRDYKIISGRNVVVDGDIQLGALRSHLLGKHTSKIFTEGGEKNNPIFETGRLFEQLGRDSSFVGRSGGSQTAGRQSGTLSSLATLPAAAPLAIAQNLPRSAGEAIGKTGSAASSVAARMAALEVMSRDRKQAKLDAINTALGLRNR